MQSMSCHEARLLLQAPHELSVLHARQLDRHLASCSGCSAYHRANLAQDVLIRETIAARAGGVSVREQVRARLAESPAAPVRRRRLLPIIRPVLAAVPLAVAAFILFLAMPRLLERHALTPAHAIPWQARRIAVGFPLTVDPAHSDHLLAGAHGQVYQSWNAGESWQPLAAIPSSVIRDLAVDASNPRRYLVATKHSVYISDDAGKHWHAAVNNLLGAENMFLVQQPQQLSTFLLGTGVLWHSVDGGRSWQQDGTGSIFAPDGIQALAIAPNGDLYSAIWNGGVAVSHDRGVHWQREAAGLPLRTLNVAIGPTGRRWAATVHGFYRLGTDRRWQYAGPGVPFFATSILDRGRYLLAGGNGAVFRSTDGGRHWQVSDSGLPLAPYVFGFVADPDRPARVYVSLDGDGIYRSDDGGRSWHAVMHGIPLSAGQASTPGVLFRRHGTVWLTDGLGSDPGNLTTDVNIHRAALSPDGAAVAYLTEDQNAWAVRVVGAGGSAMRTFLKGTGPLPDAIRWAPTAGLLAVSVPESGEQLSVTAGPLGGHARRWTVRATQLLGWTPDGNALLLWENDGHIRSRAWQTGRVQGTSLFAGAIAPALAPNTGQVAVIRDGHLSTGRWDGPLRSIARLTASCRPGPWSDSGSRLLLFCGHTVQMRDLAGRKIAQVQAGSSTRWVPGSASALLVFQRSAMWRWSGGTLRLLAAGAHPAG